MLEAFHMVLTERHRFVLTRRYGLEDNEFRTLSEVGKEMNLSRERVRQIEREALIRYVNRPTSGTTSHRTLPVIGTGRAVMAWLFLQEGHEHHARLLLSAYGAGSHEQWVRGVRRCVPAEYRPYTRCHHDTFCEFEGTLSWYQELNRGAQNQNFDFVLCTSMVDLRRLEVYALGCVVCGVCIFPREPIRLSHTRW